MAQCTVAYIKIIRLHKIHVAHLFTSSSLDVRRMLPLGANIPDAADPCRRPPCIWLRNSPRLVEISGSSIITNNVVLDKISRIFFLQILKICVIFRLALVSFAAVIRVVTILPTNGCSLELCIPFPLSRRTNNLHVIVNSCANHISRYILRPGFQKMEACSLLVNLRERNAEVE